MWIAATIFFAATALSIFIWSRRKIAAAERQAAILRREIQNLRDQHADDTNQARARQLAIFNSMVEGILILDSDMRIHMVNTSLERLFNLSRDVRGKMLMEVFRAHELLAIAERTQKEGIVRGFELTLPGIQKSRYLEVNAAAIRDAIEPPEAIILIFHDFTRIKELEGMRKDFVANVSHELRTPLTMIKGYVETLLEGAKDDPEVATRFLHVIQKHTNRLTFLIEDILTLSHLESGQSILHRQTGSLFPIIERVLDELQSAAAEKKIALQNSIDRSITVNADGDRLQQVIYNLVDNAIKYGRASGTVTVGAERATNAIRIFVRDNGPGIPAEARDRVFERFFRLDRARSREQGGTGLGLAIVKHLVHLHGGKVWVESELEKGSTFYISLPQGTSAP